MIKRFYILLLAIVASVGMGWATENSIVINGTPQVGDNSISLTYYFDPANVPGITGYAPTLKVKCVTDNIWDEVWLSLSEISSGTTTVTLNTLGSFQEGKSYDVCFAYYNGSWVDDVFQSFTPAGGGSTPTPATTDLASITSDYTVQDGEILTGTLGTNVKISIAPGATVTLSGVDINSSGTWTGGDYAGITCPGNATIILADGTVNRIKGFLNGNSAIHIKPNYTLTIEGDGTLYASTQGGAAAIGCGYSDSGGSRNGGNIVINGGTIYANGGSLAAGIGGGGRATIGNITINGGIIYAVGGGTGAGIGGGQSKSNSWKSICGNITISSNVKYLKATKGSGAEHSIGKGSSSYSVCGTVTIPGGATGYVSTNPYVYCNPDYVIELINAIPQPVVYTEECKAAIDEARAMYTALTADQKTSVTNYSTLTDAEAAYAALLVEDKIAAIGTVVLTAECKAKIDAARAAFDALSDEAKALVTNYSTLTDAETAYAALNQAEADKVIAKIALLPNPVQESDLKLAVYQKVQDARAAYDALTADQKLLVSNYAVLEAAEAAFDAIGGGGGLPTGALTGAFSVGKSSAICFSQGNLQATTADLGANWTWSFAANQWDFIGNAVANTAISDIKSVSTNGTVDLFGWSTAATYYGISNNPGGAYYTGDFIDWGTNAISNGGNTANAWHTLAHDEWDYLFNTRTTTSGIRYAKATVNGIPGIILLPDDWSATYYALSNTNDYEVDFNSNVITTSDWTNLLEANGVVFLPAAGERLGADVNEVGSKGHYWSSTFKTDYNAYCVSFNSYDMDASDYINRREGYSVRLVVAAPVNYIAEAQAALALINAIPDSVTLDEACVKAIKDARAAVDALGENAKLIETADMNKLTDAEAALTALNQAEADKVVAKIDSLPNPMTEADLKLSVYDKVTGAREAYDALTADQKPLVSNYQTLLDAEAAFAPYVGGGTGVEGLLTTITVSNSVVNHSVENIVDINQDAAVLGENGWTSGKVVVSAKPGFTITKVESFQNDGWIGAVDEDTSSPFEVSITNGMTLTKLNVYGYEALSPIAQAQAALALINAIPDSVTLDEACVKAIKDARAAVDALGENAKLIDAADMTKLTDAEAALTALNQAEADKVIAKINNIPLPVELKLATRDSINNARAAYDALNAAQQALVSNYTKLTAAEAALADLVPTPTPVPVTPTVWDMNELKVGDIIYEGDQLTNMSSPRYINNVEVIRDNKCPYTLMKSAGETSYVLKDKDGSYLFTDGSLAITPASVGLLVTNADHGDINVVVYSLANVLDSAQHVKDLIDAISTPVEYPTSGQAIAAALVAYQQLSEAAQGALDDADVQKMTDAATQYAALDAIAAIDAIPAEIVYDPLVKAAIETAREKYDALSDASKALVDDEVVAKLTNAEKAWADLVAKVEHNVSYIGKDGELKNEIVALLHIPDPAPDFNGYEFVRWDVKGGDFLEEGLHVKAVYTPIITTNPQGFDTLAYNGLAQELVKAGVAKAGHIEYSLYPEEPESWSAALPKATKAGVYAIYYKLVREGHADYIAPEPTMATIAKVPVTYVAPVAYDTLVYTASNQTLIAAGQTNDGTFEYSLNPTLPDSWNTELPQAMSAGTYNVYYRVQGDLNHLDSVAATPVVVTIAKAELTATADNKAIIFGELAPQFTVTYAGWQGDDDASVLTGDIAFACEYVRGNNVGAYTITPSGVEAANYAITFVDGTLTVNRKSAKSADITAAQLLDENLVYTNAVNRPTIVVMDTTLQLTEVKDYTLSFVGRGETQYAESATAPIHVGDYTAIVAFVGNYKDTLTVDFAIAKAPLTITAENKEVIFGENAPVFTVAYTGFLGTDTATVLTGTQEYACEYVRGDNVGDYTIIPSGVDAHDYAITFANGTLTVNRKSAKSADIVAAQLAGEKLIYTNAVNRPTIVVTDTTLQLTETKDYTLSFMGTQADNTQYAESATAPIHVGNYTAIVAFVGNYKDTLTVDFMINQAPLTITADDKEMIYGDEHPAFTVSYDGFLGTDDNSVLLGTQGYSCAYAPGSPIGTYAITPKDVTAYDYAITFVDGTLTVNKAHVYVSGAEVHIAKFADGHANAEVTSQGTLNGIKLNDPIAHVTTAAFSSADVAENLTITLFYELTGDAALLKNYNLDPTSEIFTTEGVIIEPFIPDDDHQPEAGEQVEVKEGIDVYAYGYCDGSGYSLKYHLNSGNPDQYKIDFADSRFTDVDWTNLVTAGKDGTIDIEIPVDMPTGDYNMTVYFRDSRFTWLESRALTVTFHVNLPETYVKPMFDNTIVLIDTCECFTDIQWYHRNNSSEPWQPIEGATGHYYRPADGSKLTGEYFVSAKMNGMPTYTCGQEDMETLYGADKAKAAKVSAYPNPVVTTTTVTIEGADSYEHTLRIVNLMGVEVENSRFEGNTTTVDMNGYMIGNYLISVDGIVVKVMKK